MSANSGPDKSRSPSWMLGDRNYPTEYEWTALLEHLSDDYDRRTVENLRAIVSLARDEIAELRHALKVVREAVRTDIPRTGPSDSMAYDIATRALEDADAST